MLCPPCGFCCRISFQAVDSINEILVRPDGTEETWRILLINCWPIGDTDNRIRAREFIEEVLTNGQDLFLWVSNPLAVLNREPGRLIPAYLYVGTEDTLNKMLVNCEYAAEHQSP